ncbi:MAG: rod shape-determining protein, partial [Armatimonadetes bacterium]|nr:rod shape-determining protein [Armatimonadota bacterium]
LPISMPGGNMVVDIGGGTTDIAVISLGGIVVSSSVRVGGNDLDEAIMRHVRRVYNLDIGERTAENIKIQIGSAYQLEQELEMQVRGRDAMTGLPRTITVTSIEIRDAMSDIVYRIVERVKAVLEDTPPELAADIVERGITLTGGGALLRGIDKVLSLETGIPVNVADDPVSSVAKGTGYVLEHAHRLRGGAAFSPAPA